MVDPITLIVSSKLPIYGEETQRLDTWLWAARFFKTRTLATEAVAGGKVQLAGQRTKPAKQIRTGLTLTIRRGDSEWEVVVTKLSKQRRPAKEAISLYEETEQSQIRRTDIANKRREEWPGRTGLVRKPTKKDRRELARLKRGM